MRQSGMRESILDKAAPIFNVKGFAGASISDIMTATGLQKGGIYNHFQSKDQLALEAFDRVVALVEKRHADLRTRTRTPIERLECFITMFAMTTTDPLMPGGCPILNTAIEADDTHPALRDRTRTVMKRWTAYAERTIREAVDCGELSNSFDPKELAITIVACLEGAVMLSQLHGNQNAMKHACSFVRNHLQTLNPTRVRQKRKRPCTQAWN